MASCTSPRVSASTLPISRVMSRAYFSLFWTRMCRREAEFRPAWAREPAARWRRPVWPRQRLRPRLQRARTGNAPMTSEWSAGLRFSMVLPLAAGDPLAADEVLVGGISHKSLEKTGIRDQGSEIGTAIRQPRTSPNLPQSARQHNPVVGVPASRDWSSFDAEPGIRCRSFGPLGLEGHVAQMPQVCCKWSRRVPEWATREARGYLLLLFWGGFRGLVPVAVQ